MQLLRSVLFTTLLFLGTLLYAVVVLMFGWLPNQKLYGIARSWGHFGDFKQNMAARQDAAKIEELEKRLSSVPIALVCPKCSAPIPTGASGHFTCSYCGATLTF